MMPLNNEPKDQRQLRKGVKGMTMKESQYNKERVREIGQESSNPYLLVVRKNMGI